MLNEKQRWILSYDLVLRSSPEGAPAIGITQLLVPLQRLFDNGNAMQYLNHDSAVCRIVGIHLDVDRNILVLLLQYADKNVAPPVFVQLETGAIRTEPKSDEEGMGVSAHVLISLEETTPGDQSYITLMEQVPGLHRTRVQRFLTKMFKQISEEENCTYKTPAGRTAGYRPIAELRGYPSTAVRDALLNGVLTELRFVTREIVNSQLDEPSYVRETIKETRVKVLPQSNPHRYLEAVRQISARAREENAEKLRIIYRDAETGKQQTVTIDDLEDEDPRDIVFVKRDFVELPTPMKSCESEIKHEIIELMFGILLRMKC